MIGEHRTVIEESGYRSYLLRLWPVTCGGQPTWRASLECPHTGQRTAFASLEALFDHLRACTTRMEEGGEH